MVFKGRFFHSKKSSDISSPEGSNSPRSVGSNSSSPSKSDKKKAKSTSKDEPQPPISASFRQNQVKDVSNSSSTSISKQHNRSKKDGVQGIGSKVQDSTTSLGSGSSKLTRKGAAEGPATVSPILASSLGLNRIKTRSGPLPQESFFGFSRDGNSNDNKNKVNSKLSSLGASNLSKLKNSDDGNFKEGFGTDKKKISKFMENDDGSNSDSMSIDSRDHTPNVLGRSRLQNGESSSEAGHSNPRKFSGNLRSSELCTPEMKTSYDSENPKESESPRFQAILRVTSAPRKRYPSDIKSFSHELNSKGVRPYPYWKPRGLNNLDQVLVTIRNKFDKAKEEVDSDLHIFAADLLPILEKNSETHPEWQETLEDLLVLAQRCAMTTPGEFLLQCEGIVQDLDDRRQELPMGILKKLHTRMLFILTRCTRLLQFHKESGLAEDELVLQLHSADKLKKNDVSMTITSKSSTSSSVRKYYSQEQRGVQVQVQQMDWKKEIVEGLDSPTNRNRMSSWKKLPSPGVKPPATEPVAPVVMAPATVKQSKHQHKASWGWGEMQANIFDESCIICRICEEEVPTLQLEDHSRICAVADRCDQKGLGVDERLVRICETLEKLMESVSDGGGKVDESEVMLSPNDWCRRGLEDNNMVELGPTSSAGSMTPRSPLLTPRTNQIDLLLAGKVAYSEHADLPQMNELADIAKCAGNTPIDDSRSLPYLLTCLEDLKVVTDRRKFDALTVETFGARIEKLIREKYLQLFELVDDEKVDITSTVIDEDAPLEDDVVRSLRTSPIHSKDRTSIDDFEIIKPISRGAFGRVFLAKKRTTGDLFAIKVLKKADMIRKNAVESILAERDILISVRNPFVVRFFYSFTCRENLYLVMEYLNGGDLYSLLRNLGCLDEDVARVYIAEVVLALEYLHSLRVVHRDLKPDNLLIAHDGHIKLTDFGLSKVGLINSTDDLSGPAVSGTSLMGEGDHESESSFLSESQQERRKKRSAVGTPDYLAPEILLGTGHGTSADWWSVGVILFELIVGIPPFNAGHPQTIFDNILNRNIPWPMVPDEMSPDAQDLIDQLLTEDPNQRLGARGATEVKQHQFFRDINWDTLARQKAAFIPSFESALDTSYFTSRYTWNTSEEHGGGYAASETEDSSDNGSMSGDSSCLSNRHDEVVDEYGGPAEVESASCVDYSFSNFSFKNLSQLASINYDLLTKGLKDDQPTKPNV
ncbi:hypothetical protein LXL04_035520 [Taraxacum kok-saghyz]